MYGNKTKFIPLARRGFAGWTINYKFTLTWINGLREMTSSESSSMGVVKGPLAGILSRDL